MRDQALEEGEAMTGEEALASVWDEASSIVERATAGMPDVCSDIQAAVVEMVEVQLGNVYKLGYLQGLAEGPGSSIVERATAGMPDVCSDIQAAVVEMVEVQLGNVYKLGYLQGLAEGPGWSGVSPMSGDRVLAAIRLREMPEGEISWPTLGCAVFGDEGLHERREVIAELASLIDPGPGICIGACPECGCPYDEGWSYCCQCGERLPEEEVK